MKIVARNRNTGEETELSNAIIVVYLDDSDRNGLRVRIDEDYGALQVSTFHDELVVLPRAANMVMLRQGEH